MMGSRPTRASQYPVGDVFACAQGRMCLTWDGVGYKEVIKLKCPYIRTIRSINRDGSALSFNSTHYAMNCFYGISMVPPKTSA
jgi:hypothetical protein